MFSEPQNLLIVKISSDVIWGFSVSIALKVVFTYIGAHPEYPEIIIITLDIIILVKYITQKQWCNNIEIIYTTEMILKLWILETQTFIVVLLFIL